MRHHPVGDSGTTAASGVGGPDHLSTPRPPERPWRRGRAGGQQMLVVELMVDMEQHQTGSRIEDDDAGVAVAGLPSTNHSLVC